MENIRFYKKDGEIFEVKFEEDLMKHINRLKMEYRKKYINAPDILYCSPIGYLKLRAYQYSMQYMSHEIYSIVGLKPEIVPNLSKEFDVYASKSEDYIYMIQ